MKVIVQIPCLDEEETIADVLRTIPDVIAGVDQIETLLIDDGSRDGTVEVARAAGIDHVISHKRTLGLAASFADGLQQSLSLGADIIVNTDGDNQYPSEAIADLVGPIIEERADIVVGDRQIASIKHFSATKKILQKLGSWMVRTVSNTQIPDTTSGFRAYSREAALRLNVLTGYSYTLETIIQAGKLGLTLVSLPIEVNEPTRESRLKRNNWHFIKAQAGTIVRIYAFYEPMRTFTYISAPFILAGAGLIGRFLYFVAVSQSGVSRYIQSVTIGSGLLLIGILILLFGVQADISAKHRKLSEQLLYHMRKRELDRPGERLQ